MTRSRTLIALAGIAMLAACQTSPTHSPEIEQARAAVSQARNDPAVARGAAVELQQAQVALQRAEQAAQSSRDEGLTRHLAYLAVQRAQIARNVGSQHEADARLAQAGTERERSLAQARAQQERQAREQAERTTQAAQAQAQAAQQQAREAQTQLQSEQARAQLAQQQAQQLRTQNATQAQQAQQSQALQRELDDLKARTTQRGVVVTMPGVLFDSGSAKLKPGAERGVGRLAEVLREHPERRVLIEGFTDSVGPEEANVELSRRRAEALSQALNAQGVEPDRIQTQAYGESYPVADNQSAAGRLQNRRVDIIFSDEQGHLTPR